MTLVLAREGFLCLRRGAAGSNPDWIKELPVLYSATAQIRFNVKIAIQNLALKEV